MGPSGVDPPVHGPAALARDCINMQAALEQRSAKPHVIMIDRALPPPSPQGREGWGKPRSQDGARVGALPLPHPRAVVAHAVAVRHRHARNLVKSPPVQYDQHGAAIRS